MPRVVIVGATDLGLAIARRANEPMIMEQDPDRVAMLRRLAPEIPVVEGNPTDRMALLRAGVAEAEVLVAATENEALNVLVVEVARTLEIPQLVAWAETAVVQAHLRALGVEHVVSLEEEGIRTAAAIAVTREQTTTQVALGDRSPAVGMELGSVTLPENALVAAVVRGEHLLAPDAGIHLEHGDLLTIVSMGPLDPGLRDQISGGTTAQLPVERVVEVEPCPEARQVAAGLRLPLVRNAADEPDRWKTLLAMAADPASLVILKPSGSLFGGFPPRSVLKSLIDSPAPLLVPRRVPFRRIVAVASMAAASEQAVSMAIGFAHNFEGSLDLVVDSGGEGNRPFQILAHAIRVGESLRVPISATHPGDAVAPEFVLRARDPATDLVVINWPPRSIPRLLAMTAFWEATASVLVVKAARRSATVGPGGGDRADT